LLKLSDVKARAHAERLLLSALKQQDSQGALFGLFDTVTKHLEPWFYSSSSERQRDWTDYVQWLSLIVQRVPVNDRTVTNAFYTLDKQSYYSYFKYPMPWGFGTFPVAPGPVTQRMRFLFRLPALGGYPGYPRLRTLGDQLLLACASRKCLESLDAGGLVCIAMAAVIVVAIARGDHVYRPGNETELLLEPASRWLARALPPDRDDDSVQERMLEELILRIAEHRFGPSSGHNIRHP
jgi:hypothetical protein